MSFRRSSRKRALLVAVILAAWTAAHVLAAGSGPTLDDVVARLDRYLVEYEALLSTVVADEQYEQRLATSSGPGSSRVLRSEFAFTRPPDGAPWTGFRDTFLVDGHPVRDRDARLQQLLSNGSPDAFERAEAIAEENARYNLGDGIARRTINTPTLTLDFLHPRHRTQVSFRKRGEETIDNVRLWKIEFVERPPSIILTPAGLDQKIRGMVWVDPSRGAIGRTFLHVVISDTRQARITVDYRFEPGLQFAAPSEMRESYRPGLEARARYSDFRRFQTAARIVQEERP